MNFNRAINNMGLLQFMLFTQGEESGDPIYQTIGCN